MADYSKTNEVVDDLIKRYANSQEATFTDIVVRFFRGMYSYPDDVGMALVVTVSGLGLLGPYMQRQARRVLIDMDMIICGVLHHPPNLWYFATKYMEYLQTNGRWKARLSSTAGRFVGGMLTNMALARVQVAAGVDPRYVTRLDRVGVSLSLFVLAMFGAACHAILAGEREFIGLLNRMITGETDLDLGRLQLELRFDAPWRNAVPNDVDSLTDEMRQWLQPLCQNTRSIMSR
jgi:hypothetical protein